MRIPGGGSSKTRTAIKDNNERYKNGAVALATAPFLMFIAVKILTKDKISDNMLIQKQQKNVYRKKLLENFLTL